MISRCRIVFAGIVLLVMLPSASAQEGHFVVSGIVMEAGIDRPLADAEVSVAEFVRQPYKFTEVAKGRSDASGAFRFEVDKAATYIVRASKPGYTDDGTSLGGAQAQLVLDKEHPVRDARFSLVRPGELTGRVVDDETEMPMAGFRVQVLGISYLSGQALFMAASVTPTDSDGRFVAKDLRPGKYLVKVIPQIDEKARVQVEFSEADLTTIDHDYLNAFWPGGHGLESASMVQVTGGASVSAGTVRVKKAPFYRVRVSIPDGACEAGEEIMVYVEMTQFHDSAGGNFPCHRDFLLRNLQVGSYQLFLLDTNAKTRLRVVLPFEVVDRNFELKVPPTKGPDVGGRILAAEGAKGPPPETLKVYMQSRGNIQFADERQPVSPDADGNFRFPNAPLNRVRITVSGLGAGYVVREIRYNNIPANNGIIDLRSGSVAQQIDIVVDDKPSTLTGSVADGDKPALHADVVLVKWPVLPDDVYLSTKHATGDETGKYRFSGLPPGDYRIFAVASGRLDDPGVLYRIAGSAEAVSLDRGSAKDLALKLADVGR